MSGRIWVAGCLVAAIGACDADSLTTNLDGKTGGIQDAFSTTNLGRRGADSQPDATGQVEGFEGGGPAGDAGVAGQDALVSSTKSAADLNGYVALYECRAGNPRCDLNVARLAQQPCGVTISPGDSTQDIDAKLNADAQIICVDPGDYTDTGIWTVKHGGSEDAYRVLRATRDNEPWKLAENKRARLYKLVLGGDYWLVNGLAFPGFDGALPGARITSGLGEGHPAVSFHVINRVLVEGKGLHSNTYGYTPRGGKCSEFAHLTVQNSVFRNVGPMPEKDKWEAIAIQLHCGRDHRAVNNEIYDWVSHPIQIGRNGPVCNDNGVCASHLIPGVVVENNDLYVTPRLYSDCQGHLNDGSAGPWPCAGTEAVLSIKLSGSSENPTRILHNRMWGKRKWDGKLCCNGDGGQISGNYDGNQYALFLNNIIMDGPVGINNTSDYGSFVGNVFYQIKTFGATKNGEPIATRPISQWSHPQTGGADNYEVYYNTIVDGPDFVSFRRAHDKACNVEGGGNNGELCFYRKLKTYPERICIPNGRLNPASLSEACRAGVGQTRDMGVDDRIWKPEDIFISAQRLSK